MLSKYTKDKMEDLLCQQLTLLAEESKQALTGDELANLTLAIVQVVDRIVNLDSIPNADDQDEFYDNEL